MKKYAVYYVGKKVAEGTYEYCWAYLMSEGAIVESRYGTRWLLHDYEIREEEE